MLETVSFLLNFSNFGRGGGGDFTPHLGCGRKEGFPFLDGHLEWSVDSSEV